MRPFFLVVTIRAEYAQYAELEKNGFPLEAYGNDKQYEVTGMAEKLDSEKRLKLIRKISALADGITLEYVNGLSETINDPEIDAKEKRKAFNEMDKVLRISKQYSDRELLAEGKTTANIGIDGKGTLPFKVIFTETVEKLSADCADDADLKENDLNHE